MVDLPGITRVAIHDQSKNIYEQIQAMIMKYISPEESIILNVLSAQVDFSTSESIRMSQQVEKEGRRTLAVVTKVDKEPEGLLEKVTTDAVNIGLGYVCVRNRTEHDNTIEVARLREPELFESHPALKDLNRQMVGILALVRKLTMIQSDMVKGCLPRIHTQVCNALQRRRQQLKSLPKGIVSDNDAVVLFLQVQNQRLEMLPQLVRDGNFSCFPKELHCHYTARLQCTIVDLLPREMMVKAYSDHVKGLQVLMQEDYNLSSDRARLQHRVDVLKEYLLLLSSVMS